MIEPLYFVTFNVFPRRPILARPQIHDAFRAFAYRAQKEHNIAVGRYVVMPDHVHLFVYMPREGMLLAKWIEALRTVIGKQLLRIGEQKPHWQEGFFDHVLRSDESYDQKCEYVRMNPVRAGLCSKPEDWPYQGQMVQLQFTCHQ